MNDECSCKLFTLIIHTNLSVCAVLTWGEQLKLKKKKKKKKKTLLIV